MYVSPLPSASDMEAYDRICPGAFDRILAMAEKQQSHRHIQEDRAVRAEVRNATIGQVLGFLLGLSGIGFSAIAVINGQEAGSIVGILTSIGSLMWSFKKGSDRKRESLEKRQAMM